MKSECTKSELAEHRHHLIRQRDRLLLTIKNTLTELQEVGTRNNSETLGDVKTANLENAVPFILDDTDRKLLARAIEILREAVR